MTVHGPNATFLASPAYSPHQPYSSPGDPSTAGCMEAWDSPGDEWTQRHALQDKLLAQGSQDFQHAPGSRSMLDGPFPYPDGQPMDLQVCSVEMMMPVMPLPIDPRATKQGWNGLLSSQPCTMSSVHGQPHHQPPCATPAHGALSDVSNPSTPAATEKVRYWSGWASLCSELIG